MSPAFLLDRVGQYFNLLLARCRKYKSVTTKHTMNQSKETPLLFLLGTALLIGAAAYLLISCQFDEEDFEFDTYDEDSEDYL